MVHFRHRRESRPATTSSTSSTAISNPICPSSPPRASRGPRKFWKLGRYRIPLDRPSAELRRKSQPFWKILGDHHIGCTILRVPITFPPEKFNGRLLSAMCTPDLKGTQGSFSRFTTRPQSQTTPAAARTR